MTEENGIICIKLEGDVIGGPDARTLHDLIHELINQKKTRIILDLEKVELMNSSGLGILISVLTTVRKANGDLLLLNITDRIQNLLTITKLNSVFRVFGAFDQAKAHFNQV